MPANVCTTCNRRFSKTEHLKRHERSHTTERPYRCSVCHKSYARRQACFKGPVTCPFAHHDVLFRHFKKHKQDARKRLEEQSGRSIPMQGVTSTTLEPIDASDITRMTPTAPTVVDIETHQTQTPPGDTRPSPQSNHNIATTIPTGYSVDFLSESPVILETNFHDPSSLDTSQMVSIQDQCGPQRLLPELSPPLSSGAAQQTNIFNTQLDTLDRGLSVGNFNFDARNVLASQDGTSEGSPFDLDNSWWLPLDGVGEQSSAHNGRILFGDSINNFVADDALPRDGPHHGANETNHTLPSTFENHSHRLQDFWAQGTRRKMKPMSNMWHDLTTGDGLFNSLVDMHTSSESALDPNCSWTLDSDTRQRVWLAFDTISQRAGNTACAAALTPEMVEIAYEQYVIHHHNAIPLVHMPSFQPQRVPVSLLVVMCSIGLSVMSTRDLNKLVSNIFPELLKMAADDLHASSNAPLTNRLTTMLTAFLVVTLGSVIGHKRYIAQNESLYVNLITSAQCDGLFSAHEYPPSLAELESIPSEEKRWRVWGSIEFVKRFVLQLIQFDCWYSSYLAIDPTLRMESVYIMPTCDDSVFQAPTLKAWSRICPNFSQMCYPVISASYSHTPGTLRVFDMMPSLLMLLQLRLVSATTMLDRSPQSDNTESKLLPWKVFDDDVRSKPLVILTVDLARAADEKNRSFDMNCAISWHASCMSLGANIPLFETAVGRSGPVAGAQALKEVSKWASTPSSRRSAIHASHIFRLLLNRRVSDPVKLHSIIALFQAALVLGLYILAMPSPQECDFYNLYDEVDWVALGQIGLSDPSSELERSDLWSLPAARFILTGGGIALSHYTLLPGHTQARKSWLHFASLMLGLGRWKSRTFSRILHVMCDNLSDMDPNNSEIQ